MRTLACLLWLSATASAEDPSEALAQKRFDAARRAVDAVLAANAGPEATARAWLMAGRIEAARCRLRESLDCYARAIASSRAAEQPFLAVQAHCARARVAVYLGETAVAEQALRSGEAVARTNTGRAWVAVARAMFEFRQGRPRAARRIIDELWLRRGSSNEPVPRALAMYARAILRFKTDDYVAAEKLAIEAAAFFEAEALWARAGSAWRTVGRARRHLGDQAGYDAATRKAVEYLERAGRLTSSRALRAEWKYRLRDEASLKAIVNECRRAGDEYALCSAAYRYATLGGAASLSVYRDVIELADRLRYRYARCWARLHAARFCLARREWAKALELAHEALAARRVDATLSNEDLLVEAYTRSNIAAVGVFAASHLGRGADVVTFIEATHGLALRTSLGSAGRPADVSARKALVAVRRAYLADRTPTRLGALHSAWRDLRDAIARHEDRSRKDQSVPVPPATLADIQGALDVRTAIVYAFYARGQVLGLVVTRKSTRSVFLGSIREVRPLLKSVESLLPKRGGAKLIASLRQFLWEPMGLSPEIEAVLVCANPWLAVVPFAALDPAREIELIGSASNCVQDKAAVHEDGKGVLALGDPVYAAADAELVALFRGPLPRGVRGRLPATREEAQSVGTSVLLGDKATPANLRRLLASQPRWRSVHLACHARSAGAHPALTGLLVTPDEAGDSVLSPLDLASLPLNADLVVLSACSTGLGVPVQGEGVAGPARACLMAGASRVLVSHWDVEDTATAFLMKHFYSEWWGGRSVAQALRRAQSAVRSQPRWRDPFFWAGWSVWRR